MSNTSIAATTANTSQNQLFNPYGTSTMATDFFGSQTFGSGIFNVPQNSPSFMSQTPKNSASALLHNYYQMNQAASGVTGMPTMQDYYIANQIANQFANNQTLISPYDAYFQRDMFAQQLIRPNINYAA